MKCTIYNLQFIIVLLALALHGAALYAEDANPSPLTNTPSPRSYIDLSAGGGVSHWNHAVEGGFLSIGGAATIGVGYTYFFRPFVGFRTGVHFSWLSSYATLTETRSWSTNADGTPLLDYMGEVYTHRATPNNCRAIEQTYLFEVPVGLRFRYFRTPDSRAGLHAALGAKLAIPLVSSYTPLSGTITHTGWYEQWQLELHDLPGRFETEPFTLEALNRLNGEGSTPSPVGALAPSSKPSPVNAEAYAELGAAFRLSPHYELFVAAFGQYMINNFFTASAPSHPWMAGVKVGVSIWPGKTEKEKQQELKKLLKLFPDAVPPKQVHDTIYFHDTIYISSLNGGGANPSPLTSNLSPLDSLLSEAVIWFPLDEYEPILEPAWLLDSVAAMMHRYPDLKIHINGHACRLGTDRHNQRLALLRAQAVADILLRKGISGERMFVWSFGEKHPYRYNSRKQLSKDRRVEIIPEYRLLHE